MALSCRARFLGVAMRQVLAPQCISINNKEFVSVFSKTFQNTQPMPLRLGFHLHTCKYSTSSILQTQSSVEELLSESNPSSSDPEEVLMSLSPEMEKKLKVIKLEYDVMLHMGDALAEKMTDAMWVKLLNCESKSARRRLHKYFKTCENHDLRHERKKNLRRQLKAERDKQFESGELKRAELNTIILKLRKKTMLKYYNSKLANAMIYGFPLVIDLGFENSMRPREITNLAEQIMQGHGFNKMHKEPFHLVFSNVRKGSEILKAMQTQSGILPLSQYMFTITEQSYLDLYPREQLVYLTPHTSEVMSKYDYDKVYIVGGIVDKFNPKPLTLAKAKREGIAMAKLPLDYFHKWEKGTKSLTIDQMVKILLDIQLTQNWYTAFQHIPNRKIIAENSSYGRMF